MEKLENYVQGRWVAGDGDGVALQDAVTGQDIVRVSTSGLDFENILQYARTVGNPALRKMTFHQRGNMLKALAGHLRERLEGFYHLSYQTGATRADSWIDIEGGIGNLFSYASLRRKFSDESFALDGEGISLGKGNTFMAQHILVPKTGVAVHINAFNFPVWGMLEKIAVNLLAGVPAVVKPATVSCFLTHAVVREMDRSGILPPGALQLICGGAGDLLDHVGSQDVITFTGSASTGHLLRAHPRVLAENVPFNMEADSLNCIVLGTDVKPGMPEWDIFVREVRREMTVKAGQKCTAIRRIFVPADMVETACATIGQSLGQTIIGNPRNQTVRMGSLAGLAQRKEVKSQVQKLLTAAQIVYGSLDSVQPIDADARVGAFISPLLLLNERPLADPEPHEIEAFGPVSTVMPYSSLEEALELAKKGKGSLCSTIVTAQASLARAYVLGAASHHGRILVLNAECAKESTGHGSPLPTLVHGGPGRAGGGEEMGGARGVKHYMQRVAVQGSPGSITSITNQFQQYARGKSTDSHPFSKYFEELQVGDQLVTEKRVITTTLINEFADLSGDHFYAHLPTTDFADTMFERQVAHGYFIMSAAAGLFVESYEKNPVLLNYGIDELRFTKPVYPDTEIHVRFTCKEKVTQDKKQDNEIPRGIVKWLVEIFDQQEELVGIATILTMVRKKEQ